MILHFGRKMLCELVHTRTPDLARLDGALYRTASPRHTRLDGALLFSGLAGNFYSSRLMHSIARHLLESGLDVLLANTRGHDGINWISIGGRTEAQGAAFEMVDDCRHDVAGWVRFLAQRGLEKIAIVGHSLGAIKALYAQAHQPQPAVKCIAAMSASRLNYDQFQQSFAADRFKHWFESATQLVQAGKGRQLMRVDFPFPAFIAADAYRDKYGPPSRYDWTQFIDRVHLPVLLVFGATELQSNAAFLGIMSSVDDLRNKCPQLQSQVVPGADHFYVGRRQVVSKLVCQWLGNLPLE